MPKAATNNPQVRQPVQNQQMISQTTPAINANQPAAINCLTSNSNALPTSGVRRQLAVAQRKVKLNKESPDCGSAESLEIFDVLSRRANKYFVYFLLTNKMKYLPEDQLYLIQGCLYVGIKSHIGCVVSILM